MVFGNRAKTKKLNAAEVANLFSNKNKVTEMVGSHSAVEYGIEYTSDIEQVDSVFSIDIFNVIYKLIIQYVTTVLPDLASSIQSVDFINDPTVITRLIAVKYGISLRKVLTENDKINNLRVVLSNTDFLTDIDKLPKHIVNCIDYELLTEGHPAAFRQIVLAICEKYESLPPNITISVSTVFQSGNSHNKKFHLTAEKAGSGKNEYFEQYEREMSNYDSFKDNMLKFIVSICTKLNISLAEKFTTESNFIDICRDGKLPL
ncbi:MAG: hypothetical protein MHPSP_001245, partial [Paramarteilia canceri]